MSLVIRVLVVCLDPVVWQEEGDPDTADRGPSGTVMAIGSDSDHSQDGEGSDDRQHDEGIENRPGEDACGNRPGGDNAGSESNGEGDENRHSDGGTHEQHAKVDPTRVTEATAAVGRIDGSVPGKKRINWWLKLVIAAAVVGLILAVAIFLFLKETRSAREYNPATTTLRAKRTLRLIPPFIVVSSGISALLSSFFFFVHVLLRFFAL